MTLEREAHSAQAEHQWGRFRQALKRLERKYAGRIPAVPLRRALAEDAFHCAAHWRQSPRVVRAALRELLTHPLGVERYSFAAAEYWKWAAQVSPSDLPTAEQMVEQARQAMQALDPLPRENLERMLRVCESDVRTALTLRAEAAPEKPEPPPRSRKAHRR